MAWLRKNHLDEAICEAAGRGTVVIGICGGFQMLGKTIRDPFETEGGGEIGGMGLLDIDTVFSKEKTRMQTEGVFSGVTGTFEGLNGLGYRGYEIHLGQSGATGAIVQKDNVYGSYIHGLFDENGIAKTIVAALYKARGLEFDESAEFDVHAYREAQYDKLASAVRGALDMKLVYSILEDGV